MSQHTYQGLAFATGDRLYAEVDRPHGGVDRYAFTMPEILVDGFDTEADLTEDGIPVTGAHLFPDRLTVLDAAADPIGLWPLQYPAKADLRVGNVIVFTGGDASTGEVEIAKIDFRDCYGRVGFMTHDDTFFVLARDGEYYQGLRPRL